MNELTIKEAHTYMNLAEQGMVPAIACPVNPDHTKLITDVSEDGDVFFYCLACNIKVIPGLSKIFKMKSALKKPIIY